MILAGLAALLIWIYDANLTRLIQLYVVGVFTAFTLSQSGMVLRWFRLKGPGWQRSALVNGIGAFTTGVVLVIVTITKFSRGAKVVVVAIPIMVLIFLAIHRHYRRVREVLGNAGSRPGPRPRVRRCSWSTISARPRSTPSPTSERCVLSASMPCTSAPPTGSTRWRPAGKLAAPRIGTLERLIGADRHLVRAVRARIRSIERRPEDFVTVMIPEALTRRTLWQFLVHREAFLLKTALLFEPGVVVTDIPLVPGDDRPRRPTGGRSNPNGAWC